MPFVLDASIVLSWAFADEEHPMAVNALQRLRGDDAIVPTLWWFEIRNTLIMSERRGRTTEADTAAFLRHVNRLPIRPDHMPDNAALLAIARRHRLTAYDAAYLEVAMREQVALATLDQALIAAARAENVPLVGQTRDP